MTTSETKRDKNPLPFYELPPHIKPCSQIIQETRLQLKYSTKTNEHESIKYRNPSATDYFDYIDHSPGTMSRVGQYVDPMTSQSIPGLQAVQTKRPFTPRESVNLWGMSSGKRPPSAITLSRLSFDESSSSTGRSVKMKDCESGRRKSPLTGRSDFVLRSDSAESGLFSRLDQRPTKLDTELEKSRTKFQNLTFEGNENGGGGDNLGKKNIGFKNEKMESNFIDQIDSIDEAIDSLLTLFQSSDIISKSILISILQKIREILQFCSTTGEPQRTSLLKLIFKVVERNANDEDVLFWASFILLHCQIIGNNLTTVFKMVFKASRSQAYWAIIKDSEYLDVFMYSLGEICPLTQTESMIYGYGTLKFICMDESVLQQVIARNVIGVMTLHIKLVNCEVKPGTKIQGNVQNGVFQLTSILRSVVAIDSSLVTVAASGLLEEICKSLTWTMEDFDVISNIVRILSVSSSNPLCCETLSDSPTLPGAIVKILKTWHSKDDIVVRLTYCLGNLLARNNQIRLKLFQEPLALEMIIQVIGYYLENFTRSSEDILIKSIRVLANWSLCPTIGRELCEVERVGEMLISLLESDEVSTELLLCTISTLNNLSYHKDHTKLDTFNFKVAESLYNFLTLENPDVRTETMKVLGNLTRNEAIRKAAVAHVGSILLSLVEVDNSELVCATIGVLMNVILDEGSKAEFLRQGGVESLNSLLETSDDGAVNLMICQLIWNFVVSDLELDQTGNPRCRNLDTTQLNSIAAHIVKSLDMVESEIEMKSTKLAQNVIEDEEDEQVNYQILLEFVNVAKNLHDKLKTLVEKN